MYCRRCCSPHLLRLEKKLPQDNEVFRCQECGFLFSPPHPRLRRPLSISDGEGAGGEAAEGAETNPMSSTPGATAGAGPPGILAKPRE